MKGFGGGKEAMEGEGKRERALFTGKILVNKDRLLDYLVSHIFNYLFSHK